MQYRIKPIEKKGCDMKKRHHLNLAAMAILMAMTLIVGMYGCQPEQEKDQEQEIIYPEPPEPTVLDQPGEFTVATFDSKFENEYGAYPVTTYYPKDSSGQYPAIAFSPGLGAINSMYKWVGNHLASHGYIVSIFTASKPFTLKTVEREAGFVGSFELLETENKKEGSPLYGRVDLSKRGIMGHSLGGAASLAAAENMQVDAVVALAPSPGPTIEGDRPLDVAEPIQVQTGTLDRIVGDKLPLSYYKRLNGDTKQFIDINGGNHIQFNDDGFVPGAKRYAAIDTVDHLQCLSRRYFTAWFDYFLKGDASVEPYLFGKYPEQDLQSELLSSFDAVKP